MDNENDIQSLGQHDVEFFLDLSDDEHENIGPEQRNAERILHLIYILSANTCTQQDIFERLRDYYPVEEPIKVRHPTSRNAYYMLRRDFLFLKNMGYEIIKEQKTSGTPLYSLMKGSGPTIPLLFSQEELALTAALYTMFVHPNSQAPIDLTRPLSTQSFRHPFSQDILLFIERLTRTLTPEQKSYFEKCVHKPLLYLDNEVVTEYLPHRATIDTINEAMTRRQQIQFDYASTSVAHYVTKHEHVDPYYFAQQDGHIYFVGFSHDPANPRKNRIFEWRVDRIKIESVKPQHDTVSGVRTPRPITFHYWADSSLAKSGLSQRWITHEIEREEVVGEGRQQRRRLLIRAQAYNEWRIIQQLHKYGDKVELIDPPQLLNQMRQEVKRMYELYFQSGQDTSS